YVPGGYATDERRRPGEPDFDALDDDDDAPNGQNAAALPPPGPVLSPSDPRYGRPAAAPVSSDRGAPIPTGPVLSPDDPRYGRPARCCRPAIPVMAARPPHRSIRTVAPRSRRVRSFHPTIRVTAARPARRR